ncbi:D-hexose-6-phosphate mutarotase [Rodentibacter caecimuris]|uniref:Putative glucose-6-phosphate 1-epimerase n=1 Tax=Rodentibacter caecimuris TaxID=1796644 RepID=A0A1V3KQA3_9PAST|nr:D-hexose-6-phosphate mutarotase [Rodentibacter heylii]OOF79333.1 D-hexose-6-phosphate mutarotase [Rodentibacter heylii]
MPVINKITHLTSELSLYHYNEIPVICLDHPVGKAKIALQGAQLLSWKPHYEQQDLLWLSEIEPFELGTAIRGGVPICYPWFGTKQSPAHGTARLRLWQLSDYEIQPDKVRLVFALFDQNHIIEAKMEMVFEQKCRLLFTHYGQRPAEVALHSYFHIGDITQVEVLDLPTSCFNSLTQQTEEVPSRRTINENVDCIYTGNFHQNRISDHQFKRAITLEHHNASELVLWNPWHKATSAMGETDYQKMICLETARISQRLGFGETVGVDIFTDKCLSR